MKAISVSKWGYGSVGLDLGTNRFSPAQWTSCNLDIIGRQFEKSIGDENQEQTRNGQGEDALFEEKGEVEGTTTMRSGPRSEGLVDRERTCRSRPCHVRLRSPDVRQERIKVFWVVVGR